MEVLEWTYNACWLVLVLQNSFMTMKLSTSFNCEAVDVPPTIRYAQMYSSNEVKADFKRRKQYSRRKDNIDFKPPPQDWPEPVLGVGDFIQSDQSDVTSVSPLQAYQAKLEQEFLKQQEEGTQGLGNANVDKLPESSVWTSSEEDIKELLDPNELLRHNKKLKPFVASQGKVDEEKMKNYDIKSLKKQGSGGKPTGIKSLTALKAAKTALKKSRRKTKITTDSPTRKGRKRKVNKLELTEDTPIAEEFMKRKIQMKESENGEHLNIKKKRKTVRKFAFATHHSKEDENRITHDKTKPTRTRKPKPLQSKEKESSTKSPITSKSTRGRPRIVSTTEKLSNRKINQSLFDEKISTTQKTTTDITNNTSEFLDSGLSTTEKSVSYHTTLKKLNNSIMSSSANKKEETREKRKKVKQEMEKVIKTEHLEGSFGDKDSDWTTSERRKIPLSAVTERSVLLGLLKKKIMSFVDNILKRSTKPTAATTRSHKEKFTNDATVETL